MSEIDGALALLLSGFRQDMSEQRAQNAELALQLARNAVEVNTLTQRVRELHEDLGGLTRLSERVQAIEDARREEMVRGKIYASIRAGVAALVGGTAGLIVPWLLGMVAL